jgi:hypothetical protein
MLNTRQLDWLLEDLCTKLGFCLPPEAQRRLHENQPQSVASFVEAVFRVEGLDPAHEQRLRREVHSMIADAFARADASVRDA